MRAGGHRNAADGAQDGSRATGIPMEGTPLEHSGVARTRLIWSREPLGTDCKMATTFFLGRAGRASRHSCWCCCNAPSACHHPRIVRILQNFWAQHPTDLVLSVIPHFKRVPGRRAFRKKISGAPFVTVLTDLADYPPNFWIERNSEYLICGTERARQQAFSMGHSPDRGFQGLLAWS